MITKVIWSVGILVLVCAAAYGILSTQYKKYTKEQRFLAWITCVVPFAYGGFYTIVYAAFSVILLWRLFVCFRQEYRFRLYVNFESLGLLLLLVMYLLTPIWGANHGMALLGYARGLALFLFAVLLMQLEPEEQNAAYALVPFSGTLMTVAALGLNLVPVFSGSQMQENGLAGFFEYPNTFAMLLLVGIAVLFLEKRRNIFSAVELAVMLYGLYKTGSRIGAGLLLLFFVLYLLLLVIEHCGKRGAAVMSGMVFLVFASVVAGYFIGIPLVRNPVGAILGDTSLLNRVLYAKDAIRVILRHPFGLGYMGFASVERGVQHGVYTVTYVHNGLLQLMLDTGWIPAMLLTAGLVGAFFRKDFSNEKRGIMFLILTYSLLDFHLEYLAIWLLLLPAMGLCRGKELELHSVAPSAVCAVLLTVVSIWLGVGESLYLFGQNRICLKVTPFYSNALIAQLQTADDLEIMEYYADEILKYNNNSALAWNVKANSAFASGNIEQMINCKEKAISNDVYTLEEYTDYLQKLDTARLMFASAGDSYSAEFCRVRMLSVPGMINEVLNSTDPLAWKVEHVPELTLPEEYLEILDRLQI